MTSTASFSTGKAPGALPLLGHTLHLVRQPLEFLTSLSAHGDLVEIRIGPKRAYVPCHPDLVGQVLRDPATFDKGGIFYDKARQIAASGLITCTWADHQRQRPLVQPAFSRARLAAHTTVMGEEVAAVTASWRPGHAIQVKPTMDALVTRITARTLFATDLGSVAVAQIQQSLPILTEGIFQRMMDPTGLWEKLPTPGNRRFDEATTHLHAVIDQVIHGYRASATDHGDVLSMLLASHDEQTGDRFTDQEIHDQILTILGAGSETTATTLAWALHLLGEHPDVEARMHAEIDRMLGGRLPDFDEAARLDCTRRVITEVLRLYPAAWLLTRTAMADTELGGHPISAGSTVVFSPYLLHRDPALFADPDLFDPDRWLPDRVTALQRRALVPFGAGARRCIGDVFSMTESVIALAGIGARWRLRPAAGARTRVVTKAVLIPEPLSMVTQPRA